MKNRIENAILSFVSALQSQVLIHCDLFTRFGAVNLFESKYIVETLSKAGVITYDPKSGLCAPSNSSICLNDEKLEDIVDEIARFTQIHIAEWERLSSSLSPFDYAKLDDYAVEMSMKVIRFLQYLDSNQRLGLIRDISKQSDISISDAICIGRLLAMDDIIIFNEQSTACYLLKPLENITLYDVHFLGISSFLDDGEYSSEQEYYKGISVSNYLAIKDVIAEPIGLKQIRKRN